MGLFVFFLSENHSDAVIKPTFLGEMSVLVSVFTVEISGPCPELQQRVWVDAYATGEEPSAVPSRENQLVLEQADQVPFIHTHPDTDRAFFFLSSSSSAQRISPAFIFPLRTAVLPIRTRAWPSWIIKQMQQHPFPSPLLGAGLFHEFPVPDSPASLKPRDSPLRYSTALSSLPLFSLSLLLLFLCSGRCVCAQCRFLPGHFPSELWGPVCDV